MLHQSARGIIEMPARHNQEHRSIVCEARQKIIRQPAPGLVAHEQRACLSAALDRIVNHADVQRLTSDGAADSRVAEKSLISLNSISFSVCLRPISSSGRIGPNVPMNLGLLNIRCIR